MSYDKHLAEKVRSYLVQHTTHALEEKKMFRGLAFMVNDKMCVNVSANNLMCRFDAALQEVVASKKGYLPTIMKGKVIKGYCYVTPEGFMEDKDFNYWLNLCLNFNARAKASKKLL